MEYALWHLIDALGFLQFILVLNCVEYDGIKVLNYTYPHWAEAVGWLLVIAALVNIPLWMIYKIAKTVGDCQVRTQMKFELLC